MTLQFNGKELISAQERVGVLKYWMEEREKIRKNRAGPKPWTEDPIFQHTYFCNVRREDDKVTKSFRIFYSNWVNDPMFETNVVISRLLNWPPTIQHIGYRGGPVAPEGWRHLQETIEKVQNSGHKVFGDAYIVSTNGLSMPKAQYLCEVLFPAAYERLWTAQKWRRDWGSGPLSRAYEGLIGVRGLGSFMAGQIIADLKNTLQHPLQKADDWFTWATPGPGSLRGISWIIYGHNNPSGWMRHHFLRYLGEIRKELELQGCELIKDIHNQDLQNCLCEFDKYCRILTGIGRSKRSYNGI